MSWAYTRLSFDEEDFFTDSGIESAPSQPRGIVDYRTVRDGWIASVKFDPASLFFRLVPADDAVLHYDIGTGAVDSASEISPVPEDRAARDEYIRKETFYSACFAF